MLIHKVNYQALGILFSFASLFYLRGINSSTLTQPVLLGFGFILIVSIYKFTIVSRFKALHLLLLQSAIILFLVLVYQHYSVGLSKGILNETGRLVFPVITGFLIIVIFDMLPDQGKKVSTAYFIGTCMLLLGADLLVRLIENGTFFPSLSRYEIKRGGLIFVDSNFNGFIAFLFYVETAKINYRFRWVFLIFAIWSVSIAVYLCVILHFVISFGKKYKFTSFASYIILIISLVLFSNLIFEDGSFQTKLEIINVASKGVFHHSLISGVGFGNFNTVFDIRHPSHNLFGLFAEGGILFILSLLIIFFWLYRNGARLTIFYSLVIGAISLFPVAYLACYYILVRMVSQKGLRD